MAHPFLRIQHPDGTVFEYGASFIERDDQMAVQESAGIDAVETADVEVLIDGTLLGAASEAELPVPATGMGSDGNTTYRALLVWVDDAGDEEVVVNGIVRRRGGVSREPEVDRWAVTVEDGAEDVFLEALEAIDMGDVEGYHRALYAADPADFPYGDTFEIEVGRDHLEVTVGAFTGVESTYVFQTELWVDPVGYWFCAVKDHLDGTEGTPDVTWLGPRNSLDAFEHQIAYNDGAEDRVYTHRPVVGAVSYDAEGSPWTTIGFPGMTARQVYDALAAMRAWRLKATFDAFPSRTLTVDVLSDLPGDAPADPVVLDGRREGAPDTDDGVSPRQVVAPALEDLAVAYATSLDGPPEVHEFDVLAQDDAVSRAIVQQLLADGRLDTFPGAQLYKPDQGHVAAAAGLLRISADQTVENEDTVSLPFRVLHMGRDRSAASQLPDEANHPDLVERTVWADTFGPLGPTGEWAPGIYLAELVIEPTVPPYPYGHYRPVQRREWLVAPGAGPASFLRATSAVWPGVLMESYSRSLTEHIELTAPFDMEGVDASAIQVGVPAAGVSFEGEIWTVLSRSYTPGQQSAELHLARPFGVARALPPSPLPSPGSPTVSLVVDASGYDPETGLGVVVTTSWTAPADSSGTAGAVDHYEVRMSVPSGTVSGSWSLWTADTSPTDLAGSFGFYRVEVRAHYASGAVSPVGSASVNVAQPAPAAPQNLRVLDKGSTWVRLGWDPHPDALAAGYDVHYDVDAGEPYAETENVPLADIIPAAPSLRIDGLVPDEYFFAVSLATP